jgi:hypothetical protein
MERSQNIPIFGPQGEILLVRYSPDQPRDPNGEFTNEGGALTLADKDKWTKDSVITVYHGKALGVGHTPMNPKGFYVTADKEMAEKYFGDVHKMDVPAKVLKADPENEAEQDKKLSGLESLKIGSAVVPHKYYGQLKRTFDPDQSRGADGKFTMGNVATFKNEADGISAHVTSFNGKYHVHLMDDDSGQVLPSSSIHSGEGAKEKAVVHAQKLVGLRFNEDQPRDPDGKFASGGYSPTVQTSLASAEKDLEAHHDSAAGKNERLIVTDAKTGERILDQIGEHDRVDRTENFIGRDVIEMHNHPDGNAAFSDADWKTFSWSTCKESRVVADNSIYTLQKTSEWDARPWQEHTPAAVNKRWNEICDKLTEKPGAWEVDDVLRQTSEKLAKELGASFTVRARASLRFSPDQPRDPDGKFGSSTVGGAVSINDKEFEHQQVLSSHMQEALKNGSVESYSAFKAASDSMKNNMASTNLTDRAKDDAINNLKEHVKAAEKYGDKNAAAAFNAGIESLSR